MSEVCVNDQKISEQGQSSASDSSTVLSSQITSERVSLFFLFINFLKIGSVAFGGFMALISCVENTFVKRYGLVKHQEMMDGVSLANLLPGPIAVNVVAFVGFRIRGGWGAAVSMLGVILPSFILLLVLSYVYFEYGEIATLKNIFIGFVPAVAAVVLSVVWRMGKKTIKGRRELLFAVLAALLLVNFPQKVAAFAPVAIIFSFAILGYFAFYDSDHFLKPRQFYSTQITSWQTLSFSLLAVLLLLWFVPLPFEKSSLLMLTLTFSSMSLMLFGGGFVFIPIIGSLVVAEYGWLTQQQFTDGIAMGQITPGPILISATFIGYKVAGFLGALLATAAIFAPPAILMVTVSQSLNTVRQSPVAAAAMKGIHCAVIGMIFVAGLIILQSLMPMWTANTDSLFPILLIFFVSLIGLIKFNLDVIWIIPTAGFLGYLLF